MFQLLAKTNTKLIYFIMFLFQKMNECLKKHQGWALRQEKEDQSQQISTFRCSESSILKICIAKILLLSPHRAMWRARAHSVKLGFLTRGMRHALSVMRQKSLQHIAVGMIPYSRYRCTVCGMRYAANRIPPCSDSS